MSEYPDNPFQTPHPVSISVGSKELRPFWSLALWHALLLIGAAKFFFVAVPLLSAVASSNEMALPAVSETILNPSPMKLFGVFFASQLALFMYCIVKERRSQNPAKDRLRRNWTLITLFVFLLTAFALTLMPMLIAESQR